MRSKKQQKEGFLPAQLIHKLEQPIQGRILQMHDLRAMECNEIANVLHTRATIGKLV